MQYISNISWTRETADFNPKTFDRTHTITFGGGSNIQASSAPEFAGKAELVNPEEMFTASIASCFMLTLLFWASQKKLDLKAYSCEAIGKLGKNAEGKMAMTEVILKPHLQFADQSNADQETIRELFNKAHDQCFISSSVKTKVSISN